MISDEPLIVALDGEWDVYRCPELDERLESAYAAPQVVLDLSNATYLDSTCLGALVRMRKERAARGLEPAHLVITSPMVRRIFEIVRLDRVWPIHDSLEAARKGK
jgi:anti-sigma B factor antagonist